MRSPASSVEVLRSGDGSTRPRAVAGAAAQTLTFPVREGHGDGRASREDAADAQCQGTRHPRSAVRGAVRLWGVGVQRRGFQSPVLPRGTRTTWSAGSPLAGEAGRPPSPATRPCVRPVCGRERRAGTRALARLWLPVLGVTHPAVGEEDWGSLRCWETLARCPRHLHRHLPGGASVSEIRRVLPSRAARLNMSPATGKPALAPDASQ